MRIHSSTAVYMLASRRHGTIYIGVTGELVRRISQHRAETRPGFTSRYGVKRLVWFEQFEGIEEAIRREKSLKRYPRDWKINFIEQDNPDWEDLYPSLL
jgi:putative endonuclease